ncbi:hypothetical protein [Mesorhizobium loti]|uniref:hypothetical protein n=1 Tax=Rhizobium loti TaxID=381 RepID=UPI0004130BE0|nr:hypothetical protein [Mesorhizobium loti]
MQILDTTVNRDPVPVVEFRGEGGESIAVTLAAEASLADKELIDKARVMLLQAGTFGVDGDAHGEPGPALDGASAEATDAPPPSPPSVL